MPGEKLKPQQQQQQQEARNYGNTFIFCEPAPHTMANAIRARGIATFLKCSQKQQVQTSGRGRKGAINLQQRLGKVLASRRSLHWPDMATGMGVSSSFCVVIVVVVVLVYQLARTFLLTFVIFTRELHKSCAIYVPGAPEHAAIEATATASDSCRLLQAWRVGVGCCAGVCCWGHL